MTINLMLDDTREGGPLAAFFYGWNCAAIASGCLLDYNEHIKAVSIFGTGAVTNHHRTNHLLKGRVGHV